MPPHGARILDGMMAYLLARGRIAVASPAGTTDAQSRTEWPQARRSCRVAATHQGKPGTITGIERLLVVPSPIWP